MNWLQVGSTTPTPTPTKDLFYCNPMDYLDPEVGPGRGSAKLADCPRPAPCTKSSISSHYTRCISSFTHLYHLVEASSPPRSNLLPNVAEDLGRFRVWAGNIGAHRTGRVSLDYRLREASQMHAQVTKLLTDLSTDLEKGKPSYRLFSLQFAVAHDKLIT